MIDQITVFLENKKGRVASVARTLADAGINMTALSLADSEEYGLARIVCGDPEGAVRALGEAGYRAKVVKVAAVAVPDRPGGLAELFEALDDLDVNIEYCYCFSHRDDAAVFALKVADAAAAAKAVWTLEAKGFKALKQSDL